MWTVETANEGAKLSRRRSLWSILQLMEETQAERVRAHLELEDASTRELGELRLRLVHDRHKFLDLLKRSQELSES
jgi:hypothetical protein